MRLLPLKEYQNYFENCLEMLSAFLVEQQEVSGDKRNKSAITADAKRELVERLCDSNRQIFLFENGQTLVGFAEVLLEEECFPDEDLPESCIKIIYFYILPQVRRQKLGSVFFKLIRAWGRDKKVALIEAEAPNYPIAVNQFFEKQGLELVGAGAGNCYRAFI